MLPSGYSKEELKTNDRAFVNGMEHFLEYVDTIVANYDLDEDSLLDKLKAEIIADFVEHLKMFTKSEIDEVIMGILDGYEEE